jgi:hypothetical protein
MDIDLPGYAWDLLPYKEKPFDLYRCPMWHAEYKCENRTPYLVVGLDARLLQRWASALDVAQSFPWCVA